MKALAIDAANDSNTDEDRRTIQKEMDQRREVINDIVLGTKYNGKILLDGRWEKVVEIGTASQSERLSLPDSYESVWVDTAEPPENYFQLNSDSSTVETGGIYEIDSNFTGTIQVNTTDAVKFVSSTLQDVTILGPSGNANITIENMNIRNTNGESFIRFQGAGNVLTISGTNTFTATNDSSVTTQNAAAINSGAELNVQGSGTDSKLTITDKNSGACIGADGGGSVGDIRIVNANLSINAGKNAGIGSGTNRSSVGNITIEQSTLTFTGGTNSCIGSGYSNSSAGDILVVASKITDTNSIDTCIGSGYSGSSCGNITVLNSVVDAYNRDSPAIGAGDARGTCRDILISNSEITCSSEHGAAVGSGRNATVLGNITVSNGSKITHTARPYSGNATGDGAVVGTGLNGRILGEINIFPDSEIDATNAYLDANQVPPYSGIGIGRGGSAGDIDGIRNPIKLKVSNPLWIQHGTQAGERIYVYVNNMNSKALGIDHAEVTTRDDANFAIDIIDRAIEIALDEATTMGAYLQRMETTFDNVVTMRENTQASESVIRDTDMAKEAINYTRYNILARSSQAMLAQANQNGSLVLGMFERGNDNSKSTSA